MCGLSGMNKEARAVDNPMATMNFPEKAGQILTHRQKEPDKINYYPGCADRLKYAISCPPHGKFGRALTWFVLFLLLWGSLISVTGDASLPGGNLFTILVLFVAAKLLGMAVDLVKIPPLLGMLVVGIVLSSISEFGISEAINPTWSGALRSMALTVILLMAGLGLDPAALKRLSLMVFRLAFTPCIVEASVVATCTHFLLGFPWLWGFMLGFVLGAVTPAVVVPCLLSLSERGYGVDKGIPTLVIAASSVDDVLAISGFGVLYGLALSGNPDDSMTWQFLKGPVEVVIGIIFGGIMGTLAWVLPNRSFEDKDRLRFYYLIGCGLVAIFGSEMVGFAGAGALGCLSMAFIAGIGWRRQGMLDDKNPTNDMLNSVWEIFEPLLFVLIGTEIKVGDLKMETVGWGVLVLIISLSFRMVCSFMVAMGGGLNMKERLFVSFAWLPKATVQCTFWAIFLDIMIHFGNKNGPFFPMSKIVELELSIKLVEVLFTPSPSHSPSLRDSP
ncbi:unnamed protein product, partial [Meganyctiphanes norvegica]